MSTQCVAVIQASGGSFFVLMEGSSPPNVRGFTSLENGLEFFESAYMRGHSRSYEASMSACLSNLTFSPSIVPIEGVETVLGWLGGVEPRLLSYSNVAGTMLGLVLPDAYQAGRLWDSGTKPRLIKGLVPA